MSFVSVVAREKFITIMSDGRVSSGGKSVGEEYQKFIKINNNFFIAFAGEKEIIEILLTLMESHGVNALFAVPNFDIVDAVFETLLLKSAVKDHNVMLAYGGISKDNDITFSHMSTKIEKPIRYSPKGDQINYCFLNNGKTDSKHNNEKFIDFLKITGLEKPQEILKSQKMMNDYIAGLDNSVNTHTFELTINRKAALQ